MRLYPTILWALPLTLFACSSARASDYSVQFGLASAHPTAPEGADVIYDELQPWPWRSVGFSDAMGNLTGAIFTNRSRGVIKAIHLKVNKPKSAENPSGDTFSVTSDSAHGLFDAIWLKNDNTEVIYMDGAIPNAGRFWNQLPANSDTEIRTCDRNPSMQTCPFSGQIFRANPPDPDARLWTKIKDHRASLDAKWRAFRDACPSDYRSISVYGESDDGKQIVFISNGRLMLFDSRAGLVSFLEGHRTERPMISRIAFENGVFVLHQNGAVGTRLDPAKWKADKIEGMNSSTKTD